MALQMDFGGFDPSFLGVTIRFGSPRAWNAYQDLGASQPPASIPRDPDEAFETLSVASVLAHEIRHFHDFFLSPYSARVFRWRVHALVSLMQLMPFLIDEEANCMPLPLSTWSVASEAQRQRYLAQLPRRTDGKQWNPVRVPYIDPALFNEAPATTEPQDRDDAVRQLIISATRARSQLNDLTYNPRTVRGDQSFQPWQLLELSAMLVQMQELFHIYGPDAVQQFLDCLLRMEKNPYAAMLNLAVDTWSQCGEYLDPRMASAMVLWSVAGSYEVDDWKACPTERFVALWAHIMANGLPSRNTSLTDLFEQWSAALKLSTIDQGLDEATAILTRMRDALEKGMLRAQDSFLSKKYAPLLLRMVDKVIDGSRHMVGTFRADPENYVDPMLYLEHLTDFVNPILRIVFEGGFLQHRLNAKQLEQQGYIIEWAVLDADEPLIASMLKPIHLSQHAFVDPQDANEMSSMIELTDFMFSLETRNRWEVQRAGRVYFEEQTIKPLNIMTSL